MTGGLGITAATELAWAGTDSAVCGEVVAQARANLEAYRVNPPLLEEQVNIELAAAEGGYQGRQLYELIQNGADALLAAPGGRLQVVLTDNAFYCANEGEPIDVDGVRAILLSNVSQKRGDQIGRFGLGFKSVLEVSDDPEFYSRSGSFAWNYGQTRREIASVLAGFKADRDPAPRLRLAWPQDPRRAFENDEVLAELAQWATTIVKLPLHRAAVAALSTDLTEFPAEFLLFCRHVGQLTLENRSEGQQSQNGSDSEGAAREITVTTTGSQSLLCEDGSTQRWILFSKVHKPSTEATADAGVMSRRERVPIDWALPLDERPTTGVLWTFFPTDFETTLSGIVNAPWKTNPDRRNLLEGAFNRELLGVVAEMVVENLPVLRTDDDPGRLLDIIPARGREARGWEDRALTERVYELATAADSLPDVDGTLRRPGMLTLAPSLRRPGEEGEATAQRLLSQWAEASPDRAWCHRTVDTRERRPRAERLVKDGGGEVAGFTAWLEALVPKPDRTGSAAAVILSAELLEEGLAPSIDIVRAKIVLTADGRLVEPDPDDVFLRSDYDAADELDYVDDELAADPAVRTALAALGISAVDAGSDFEAALRTSFTTWSENEWRDFWGIARRIDRDRAVGILRARRKLPFVLTCSGRFRPLRATLLPGAVIPDDGSRDRDALVDIDFHDEDLDLLRELGLRAAPETGLGSTDEAWFDRYEHEAVAAYRLALTGARRPQERLLGFLDKRPFAGPLVALESLGEDGRALFTEAALAAERNLDEWAFGHTSQRDSYPVVRLDAPLVWRLRREGRLRTSRGIRPIAQCVAQSLIDWRAVLPVAECGDEAASRLKLPTLLDDLGDDHWEDALSATQESTDDVLIGRLYGETCKRLDAPERIRCRVGETHLLEETSHVSVVFDEREFAALRVERIPAVFVGTRGDADDLRERWGMSGEQLVTTNVAFGGAGEPVPLTDRFPALELQIAPEKRSMQLVACEELRLETITAGGRTSDEIDFYVENECAYFRSGLPDEQLLKQLAPSLDSNLDEAAIADVLQRGVDLSRRQRRKEVRNASTIEARLLAAVGPEALKARLPKGLIAVVEARDGEPSGLQLAELALAVYGIDILRVFRAELHEAGLEPPQSWAGGAAALSFVRKIGFAREFAGFQHPRRSPLLEVEGPPDLPQLHDFQRVIADEFRRLIRNELGGSRALLSLPTGAGKTRVAVEALIESVQQDDLKGPILWVTQSDELCEQAVQTWSFVWRGIGPIQGKLALSRLWAGNEAEPIDDALQVVVATIQKLQAACIGDAEYDWLSEAGCVVIDEAHHSTTPEYTKLLTWLGLGRGRDSRPLVGLTATPFRGTSERESARLVSRYGARRLDTAAFGDEDPYPILQQGRVLAHVKHRILGGSTIELDPQELKLLERTRLLPRRAEERLGRDVDRNTRLLEEIKGLPPDWTTLLFATSVDHAQTMAALLTLAGISAKPITGLTEAGPRRHYIEQFREGELRVLTNYAVLTQGFDAPAVRAIIVARPTYSPGLYQQMIGRGLRGPENGGKPECLIINVEDNVRQFGDRLAFRDFEYLWEGEG